MTSKMKAFFCSLHSFAVHSCYFHYSNISSCSSYPKKGKESNTEAKARSQV
ncbi:hypothetical protein ES319_D07G124200v1 [Gossypium barbadense]|uniref:Uncharacterized protein n=1 Tax=Gossypium barbadense TaxID=3634 RepID=A0A5J5QS30_GOSBA|nr:hypothetical protein ES319_D07G124200v1 [Gossypium barbadense]